MTLTEKNRGFLIFPGDLEKEQEFTADFEYFVDRAGEVVISEILDIKNESGVSILPEDSTYQFLRNYVRRKKELIDFWYVRKQEEDFFRLKI